MNIFEKLMLARQLSFKEGKIELLGQNLVFSPADFFSRYIYALKDKPELIISLYNSAKSTMKEGFSLNVGKSYGFSFKDYARWFVDIAELSGWGQVVWEDINEAEMKGVITITNSPVAANLKNKVSAPCDHITRGFMAGAASSAFKEEVDMIEIECEALGAQKCKFIMGKIDYLKSKFPDIVKNQVVL
jgi:predicted hydrocarbon binding protein